MNKYVIPLYHKLLLYWGYNCFNCTEAIIALIVGWSILPKCYGKKFFFCVFCFSNSYWYLDTTKAAMNLSLDAPYHALLWWDMLFHVASSRKKLNTVYLLSPIISLIYNHGKHCSSPSPHSFSELMLCIIIYLYEVYVLLDDAILSCIVLLIQQFQIICIPKIAVPPWIDYGVTILIFPLTYHQVRIEIISCLDAVHKSKNGKANWLRTLEHIH